ncbi:MAG: hypothetical protein DMF49_10995 [Acidobacteria bacterium]|nr:MAG: hypothetical protein DMF49_10995 [Acidobacteriota bacterium]
MEGCWFFEAGAAGLLARPVFVVEAGAVVRASAAKAATDAARTNSKATQSDWVRFDSMIGSLLEKK